MLNVYSSTICNSWGGWKRTTKYPSTVEWINCGLHMQWSNNTTMRMNERCTTMHETMAKYHKLTEQKKPEVIPYNSLYEKFLNRKNQSILLEIRVVFTHGEDNNGKVAGFKIIQEK